MTLRTTLRTVPKELRSNFTTWKTSLTATCTATTPRPVNVYNIPKEHWFWKTTTLTPTNTTPVTHHYKNILLNVPVTPHYNTTLLGAQMTHNQHTETIVTTWVNAGPLLQTNLTHEHNYTEPTTVATGLPEGPAATKLDRVTSGRATGNTTTHNYHYTRLTTAATGLAETKLPARRAAGLIT